MDSVFPWDLRIEHLGFAHLRLQWVGGILHFDPCGEIGEGDTVVLLWNWAERLQATADAVREGKRPVVVAPKEILGWLEGFGELGAGSGGTEVQGIGIELREYSPIPEHSVRERMRKAKSAITHSRQVARRLRRKRGLPSSQPRIASLVFPSGARLLHMNLSLHGFAARPWIEEIQKEFPSPDWLIAGCDYHHDESVLASLPGFEAERILVTDLLADSRRSIGLPVQLLTPLVDQAMSNGLDAYVFSPHASFRFDTTPLTNKT
jgi:hypothetical protein